VRHGVVRTEVGSNDGDSHLGHVVPDGLRARGGLRCCISSASLRFIHHDDVEVAGLRAIEAATAHRVEDEARSLKPDLVLLDLGLPDADGESVVKAIRSWSSVPVPTTT
jgi:CheY-like chemotaxis protein